MNEDALPWPRRRSARARVRAPLDRRLGMGERAVARWATLPAVALVRAAYGRHPRGDAPLWDAGALPLLGLLSREANGVRAATTTAAVVLLFGAVAGLVPLAALMVSISTATRDGRAIGGARTVARGVSARSGRSAMLLLVLMGVGQGLVVAARVSRRRGRAVLDQRSLGEARAQQLATRGRGGGAPRGASRSASCTTWLGAAVVRFQLGAMRALGAWARGRSGTHPSP